MWHAFHQKLILKRQWGLLMIHKWLQWHDQVKVPFSDFVPFSSLFIGACWLSGSTSRKASRNSLKSMRPSLLMSMLVAMSFIFCLEISVPMCLLKMVHASSNSSNESEPAMNEMVADKSSTFCGKKNLGYNSTTWKRWKEMRKRKRKMCENLKVSKYSIEISVLPHHFQMDTYICSRVSVQDNVWSQLMLQTMAHLVRYLKTNAFFLSEVS